MLAEARTEIQSQFCLSSRPRLCLLHWQFFNCFTEGWLAYKKLSLGVGIYHDQLDRCHQQTHPLQSLLWPSLFITLLLLLLLVIGIWTVRSTLLADGQIEPCSVGNCGSVLYKSLGLHSSHVTETWILWPSPPFPPSLVFIFTFYSVLVLANLFIYF